MNRTLAMVICILMLLSQQSCRQTIDKTVSFDIRVDLVSPSQIKIIEESGAKILNIYPAYLIAKATTKQFDLLVEQKMLVVKLPDMDKVYGNPTGLKEANHNISMDVYRSLWDFIGFKPILTKKYKIQEVISEESLDNIERWFDSFYSFMYELHQKVVEEIRKDERIKEEAIPYSSDSITNSFININTHEDLKKLIQDLKTTNETISINLTEKYFTGKERNDIFLVVQLTRTGTELEVTIINYKLVLSVIGEKD